ncbi:unnamed protein product [Closterium sp. Naga37s-1]|nr:unnamed protein product [Closterium sp. Naga37s-1]
MPRRWYNPAWYDEHIPSAPYDPLALRVAFEKAVVKRLMTEVPFGMLLSGGLDSSLVAAVAQRHLGNQWGPQLHSYCIGLESTEAAGKQWGAQLHSYCIGLEGIDAISEVIYHTETFDVATIRASTPMFLLSRKIKALGVKMVLSGEGSDEVFGGYLYFHKAPSKEDFHWETCLKLKALHMYDCVRAKKATSAWGLEVRVPFLDKEFLDVAMSIDPQYKMIRKKDRRIEKWVIRRAFDDEERPYLPKHILYRQKEQFSDGHILYRQKEQFSDGVEYSWIDGLKAHAERMHILYRQKEQFSDGVEYSWIDGLKAHAERMDILYRQKEQFSDGVGYSWIDVLKAHAERMVSDQMMANAPNLFTHLPPKTKEALFYRHIFEKHFPQVCEALQTSPLLFTYNTPKTKEALPAHL